ncbi:DUF5103 domain-containing protein [Aurantibacter sp.]|uniref:type IX secretion system plug protein n=1 Tax=Aurantibacter sp. TaxID=2807103 RepID=UPI0035C85B6E
MNKTIKPFFLFLFLCQFCISQVDEIIEPDYIKTITFKGNTPESQLPVIKLGDFITMEFDALNGDEEDYYYKIQHYNFDWTPSVLAKAEYLNGFDEQRIRTYENSFNTYQIYSHYDLTIPNEFTRGLTKSGNYMVYIYDDNDDIIFSRKFMIHENGANVGLDIKRSRDVSTIETKQTVDIVIDPINFQLNNPKETIKTIIVQNNNLTTSISNIKPQYILGNQLTYRYTKETAFDAGNEFLFFENKDIRASVNGVQYIELNDLYENILFTNSPRKDQRYTYFPDINGNFLVTVLDRENPDIEADYAFIHFSLKMDDLKPNESVHIYGNFNNYHITENTKMVYNYQTRTYQKPLLLKQGFYNYKYIVVNNDTKEISHNKVDGDFWQTENSYKVLVYYRDLGARYDRLIGFGETSSTRITN